MKSENNPIFNSPIVGYAHHRIILDEVGNPIDYEFLEVNPTFEKLTGLKSDVIVGKTAKTVMPDIEQTKTDWVSFYGEVALNGVQKEYEQYSELLKKWYRVHVYSTEKHFFSTMSLDITANKLALENENQLRNITNALNESTLVSITDQSGKIVSVNNHFCNVSCYSEEELLGQDHRIVNSGYHDVIFWRDLWRTISQGKVWKGEIKNRSKDGREYWVSSVINPLFDENGKITHYISIRQDITERKKVEAVLLSNKEQYQSLVNNIPGITYRCKFDKDWTMLFISAQVDSITGYSAEELLDNTEISYGILIQQEDQELVTKAVGEGIKNNTSWEIEYRVHHKDGSIKWVYEKGTAIKDGSGQVQYLDGFILDITERKQSEEKLLQSMQILDNVQIGFYLYHLENPDDDSSLRMIYANPSTETMTGIKPSKVIGKTLDENFPGLRAMNFPQRYAEVVKTGESRVFEDILYEDSRIVQAAFSVKAFPLPNNHMGIAFENITASKRAEQEIEKQKDVLLRIGEIAKVGGWEYDVINNINTWSKVTYDIHEMPYDFVPMPEKGVMFYKEGEHRDKIVKIFTAAVQEGKAFDEELLLVTVTGKEKWVRAIGEPVIENGKCIRITGIFQDIDERKRATKEIENTKDFLSQTGQVAKVGGWEYNNLTGEIFWTDTICDIHEVPHGYVPTFEQMASFYTTDSLPKLQSAIQEAMSSGMSYDMELQIITKKGNLLWVRAIGKAEFKEGVCVRLFGVLQNINEQKKAQEALKTSEQTLKTYIDASPLGIFVADLNGNYLDANKAGEILTGYSRKELLALSLADIIHPEHTDKGLAITRTTIETGKGEVICPARRKDGTPFWLWIVAQNVNNEYILAFCQDVSERINAEEELNAERMRLAGIIEGTNVGTWEWNVQTGETVFNERWAEIIGYTLEEISPVSIDTWMKFADKDDMKASGEQLESHFRGELEYYDFESRMKHKNGHWIWILDRGKVVSWTEDGKPLLMLGTHQDITERKNIEKDREYQMTLLKSLFEESTVGIALNDLENGLYIEVNDKLIEPTGYTKEEFLALSYWDLTPKEYEPLEAKALAEMKEKGFYTSFEKEYTRKDGSRYPVRLNGVVVESIDGKKHVWSIVEDITERKRVEKELIMAKQQAESASKAKSEFLANMSHEIRTPLNGVIGFTDLLKETSLSPVQQEYVNNANVSGHALLEIINDILDFSKIEAGMLHLEAIQIDMIELLENSIDIVKYQSCKKNLELLLNIDLTMPRLAVTDPIRLKQVLANLLGNAVKFTEKGEVELKVQYEALEDGKGKISFFVRDTGIGITEEQMSKLFKAFSQADSSTTRKFGGTGLGLIISDMIIKEMGGKIQVQSKQGEGTTFYFEIVTEVEDGERLETGSIERIKHCLIIDDNANNRHILEDMLANWGIEHQSCDNGLTALKLLETSKPFDVIICDYNMPYIDGLETIRLIRNKLKLTSEKQPVILLHSSSDTLEFYKQCEELGIRFNLIKPVKSRDLYAYLCQVYKSDKTQTETIKSKIQEQKSAITGNFNIIIAEDVEVNMILITAMISRIYPDAILHKAVNGLDVIRMVSEFSPDLILMDVQMPELDGLQATMQIRAMEKESGQHIPIIALTANAFKEEREKCIAAGMDDFLTKPVESEKINSILLNYCSNKDKSINDYKLDLLHFNMEAFLARFDFDEALINELLEIVLLDFPLKMEQLYLAIQNGKSSEIHSIAHQLNGSALNVNCSHFSIIAQAIEKMAFDEDNIDLLNEKYNELKLEWNVVNGLMEKQLLKT